MTISQRHSIDRLAECSAFFILMLVVGVLYLVTAGVCAADQFESAQAVAEQTAGTFTHAIDVAAGKSVLWLALSGLCLTVIAIIALIVVMFKVISKGYEVITDLTTSINSRPCAYNHFNPFPGSHKDKK